MKKTFITTTLIAGYFVLMSSLGIIAAVPARVHQSVRETVRNEIVRNLSCPDFIITNSETNQVKAVVHVDANGNVSVEEANSANPQLQNYVLAQLQHLKVNTTGFDERFVLVINFKVD